MVSERPRPENAEKKDAVGLEIRFRFLDDVGLSEGKLNGSIG